MSCSCVIGSRARTGRRTCSHTLQRVREARQQRNRRPDLEPSGQKNGERQRQVRNRRSIQGVHGAL